MGKDLTEGSILKTIIATSWPMIVAFMLQSAFNIVDAYFVGKISADALAAVSVSFPVVFLLIALSTGIGIGTSSLVARYVGAKDLKKAGEAGEHAILISIILSVFLAITGLIVAGFLFDLMGVTDLVRKLSLDYINIILVGSPLMFIAMVANSIIRGEGEMKVPMYIMGGAAVLNIILDPIFIFTLDFGVKGAAYATVLARSTVSVIAIAYLYSARSWVRLNFRKFKYNWDYVKGIFHVGIPSSLSNLSMSVGMFLLTIIVAGFGTEALAAWGIGFRLDSMAIMPAIGVSVAVVSLVGQNVGAGQYNRAQEITYKAGFMVTALMSLVGVIFFLFPEAIVSLFNNDLLVIEYGASFLRIVPISYLIIGVPIAISGAFLGSGHAMPALTLSVLRVIVLSVPLAYTLSKTMGIEGIWWGLLISSIISSIVAVAWFKKGTWKKHTHAG